MQTKISQNIKAIILGLVVVIGASYVSAAWTTAPASPPNGNVDAPINVGDLGQQKTGPLTLLGGLTTNAFNFLPSTGAPSTGQVLMADDTGLASGKVKWGTITTPTPVSTTHFGDYSSRLLDTVYSEGSDGFVVFSETDSTHDTKCNIYLQSPAGSTVRQQYASNITSRIVAPMTTPVKNGASWKLVTVGAHTSGGVNDGSCPNQSQVILYWIPLLNQ